ncbi:DUF983 domain-containing protein [Blastomonas sp.]|uniref:DUF983 domain-containing protein n=1 Tax=Blastomonas sp. TaxID=1909299 RepID=UPI003594109D
MTQPGLDSAAAATRWRAPQAAKEAAWRGGRNRCPRCGEAVLFARYLKPVARCPQCQQDWTLHQADDFPAYLAILISGHIMAPAIIAVASREMLPLWGLMVLTIGMALGLTLALLQPAKGVVIALQFWWGLHGFEHPARPEMP